MNRIGPTHRGLQCVAANYELAPGLEWRASIMSFSLSMPATVLVEAYLLSVLPQDDWLRQHGAYALHTQVLFPSLLVGVEAMLRDEHQWRAGDTTLTRPTGRWKIDPINDAAWDVRLTASRDPPEDWYVLNHVLDRAANEFFAEQARFLARWPTAIDNPRTIADLVEQYHHRRELYHSADVMDQPPLPSDSPPVNRRRRLREQYSRVLNSA